jgi:PAS domain S-box-containing protein
MGDTISLTVLLVDDVEENLELLEEVLSEHQYRTVRAQHGLDALEVLQRETVHLIVADAMMPRMDGFMLCKEVRSRPDHAATPFLIYTGNYVDATDQEFARSIGVDRYVVKYAGLDALVQAVNDLAHERYGRPADEEKAPADKETLDEQAFLEQHRAILIRKLEEKMVELQMYTDALEKKNREIQASENRYRTLFEQAGIAIVIVDRNSGEVLDLNSRGVSLLEYSRNDLLELPGLPIVEPGDFTKRMLESDVYLSGEATIKKKAGGNVDVEIGVGPMTGPEDNRVLLYIRDITEQKRMREQLMQMEKMSLMGRLAAGIAHEIRNPLSAISLNLQFLHQKLEAQPELRELIQDALEGTSRVESVMENTLKLARVGSSDLRESNVNDLVSKVAGFLRISAQQKKLILDTAYALNLPSIMADEKQAQQVIINIVQNAIDASPSRERVEISTQALPGVDLTAMAETPCVVVAVRDHGAGIPPEQRKHLFEQFRTTKAGGTGLGLALSKQIMEKHNGMILIDPAEGGGTIARIVFPIHST